MGNGLDWHPVSPGSPKHANDTVRIDVDLSKQRETDDTWKCYMLAVGVVLIIINIIIAVVLISGCSSSTSTTAPTPAAAPPLPCSKAGVQAPRDVTTAAQAHDWGGRSAMMATLTTSQKNSLALTNLHIHLGAEHKSDYYKDANDTAAWTASKSSSHRRQGADTRPGFMCSASDNGWSAPTSSETASYSFQHCKGLSVGKSFELHYVYSSAGDHGGSYNDGLTVAAGKGDRQINNPMVRSLSDPNPTLTSTLTLTPILTLTTSCKVVVNALVIHIINSAADAYTYDDLKSSWNIATTNGVQVTHDNTNSFMYAGSTTGSSFNNDVCSPYAITWHVDPRCHLVSAASMDKMCEQLKAEGVTDVSSHNSRELVSVEISTKNVVALV